MARKLIELDDARRVVLESASVLDGERVALPAALDRTLAEDVIAQAAVPPFDNSAMDGFALRAADVAGAALDDPARLELVGESRAGRPAETTVGAGQTVAISTGAMMPEGADAVTPLEDARRENGVVEILAQALPGAFVRRTGDDIDRGAGVLARGSSLGPAELGVLASLGAESVSCVRRAGASFLATGDELAAPGVPLWPGAIRDANGLSLPALARRAGAEVTRVTRVADDPGAIEAAVAQALAGDVVVVSGGASVGDHDHLKGVLAQLAIEQRFWGVALRPGKPTWFGTHEGTLVFGLPGNPVSAMVTFILFVAPALRALAGAPPLPERTMATLTSDYEKEPGRAHAVRCRLQLGAAGWEAQPTGPQGSHILTSMLGADALAIIPSDSGTVPAGTRVQVELLGPFAGAAP